MTFKLPAADCYDAMQDMHCYSAELVKEVYEMGLDAKPECTCAAKDMPFGKCCKATLPTTRDEKIVNPGVYVTDAPKPTGWDNGLSQDYNAQLGKWFADQPGARQQIREMFEKDDYEGTPV